MQFYTEQMEKLKKRMPEMFEKPNDLGKASRVNKSLNTSEEREEEEQNIIESLYDVQDEKKN